jgi:ubiquinone/menaquinone biosynthesis C-methylase UbiE
VVVEALGDFDPQSTYDEASRDYEDASRDYWQYLSARTVDALGLKSGERVLDAPCGTGAALILASERVGATGRVVGLDYAEQMVALARERVRASGIENVQVRIADMTAIAPPSEPFDALLCVLGVFFVDDMPGLVRSFFDLVRPAGGRVGVAVFGEHFFEPLRTVFVDAVAQVLPSFHVVEPWRRLETEQALEQVFAEAGIADFRIRTNDDVLALPSPDDWWRIVMGSGLRRSVTAIGDAAAAEVRAYCDSYIHQNAVRSVQTRSRYATAVRH